MESRAEAFTGLVSAIVRRFFAQNGHAAPAAEEMEPFVSRLWATVTERGLPRPLAAGERGVPGEMSEAEVALLLARVLPEQANPLLAEAARQLVKACFYPEFKDCRDSFCAVTSDGSCRRQELARARKRVSGTHCVDCPHWVGLRAEEHVDFLSRHWRSEPDVLAQHRDVFVPEDFRALRQWLHARARATN